MHHGRALTVLFTIIFLLELGLLIYFLLYSFYLPKHLFFNKFIPETTEIQKTQTTAEAEDNSKKIPTTEKNLENISTGLIDSYNLNTQHLTQKAEKIIKEWQSVKLEDFACEKLSNNALSFVFIPYEYDDYQTNNESKIDLKLYSQYFVWAVNQEEPFKSYSSLNNYLAFTDFSKIDANFIKTIDNIIKGCPGTTRPLFISIINTKKTTLRGGGSAFFPNGFIQMKNPGYKLMIADSNSSYFNYHMEAPHETGHAFAGFLDEYQFSGKAEKIWPNDGYQYINDSGTPTLFPQTETPFNKSEVVPSCPSLSYAKELWGDLINSKLDQEEPTSLKIGFYAGCTGYKNRYRATNSNMMSTGNEFNLVQKRFLCKLLIKHTQENLGYCNNFY